jgi:hypothetical protein
MNVLKYFRIFKKKVFSRYTKLVFPPSEGGVGGNFSELKNLK